jgi:hypothetical protein
MKSLRIFGLAAIAAMALTALAGAGSASATQLYKNTTPGGNDKIAIGTANAEITASLKTGTSALLKDTGGSTNDTCTSSEVKGKIEEDTSSTPSVNPTGKVSTLSFGGCTHTTDVLAKGSLEIRYITGSTNGVLISKEAQVTVQSTVFGISCTANTGTGTSIGTLTGAAAGGQATVDINGVINMGAFCGDSTWTGTYIVTSPTGLMVEQS